MTEPFPEVRQALALFRSAVLGGESWSPACEAANERAKAELDRRRRELVEAREQLAKTRPC